MSSLWVIYKALPLGLKLATPSINCPSTESSSSSCWWISSILNTKQYRTWLNVRYSAAFCKRPLMKCNISRGLMHNSWTAAMLDLGWTGNRLLPDWESHCFVSKSSKKQKEVRKQKLNVILVNFTFLLSHPFLLGVFQYHQAFLNLVRRKSVG